jgi:hypothetical protein
MSDNSNDDLVECAYCGANVSEIEPVPPVDDNEEWERLATDHSEGCEWIETRAHRIQPAHESFLSGFMYGKSSGATELTNREVTTRWPGVDLSAFVQGMLDGLAGDEFRLTMVPRGPYAVQVPG